MGSETPYRGMAPAALSHLSRLVGGAFLFILLARAWSPELFGYFALHHALAALLGLIAGFGFPTMLLREVGAKPTGSRLLLEQAMRAQAVPAAAAALMAAGIAVVAADACLLGLLFAASLALNLAECAGGALRGLCRHRREAAATGLGNALALLLPCAVLPFSSAPESVAAALLAARIVQCTALLLVLRPIIGAAPPDSERPTLGTALRSASPYAAEAMAVGLLLQVDTLFVGYALGERAVGIYQAGVRFVVLALIIAQAASGIFVPRLAARMQMRESFGPLYRQLRNALVLYGIALAVPFLLVGEILVQLVYAPDYAPLVQLMPLFGVLVLVRCIAAIPGIALLAAGEQSFRARLTIGTAALYLLLALMAVQLFGLSGAILANAAPVALLGTIYRDRMRARFGARLQA